MVLGISWYFWAVLGGSWWFLVDSGGYPLFIVVLGVFCGSRCFLVDFGCS